MTQPIETIDVAGVRAIVMAIGHRRAHRLLRKATSETGRRSTTMLPCLGEQDNYRQPALSCHGTHATIYHSLGSPKWWMEGTKLSASGLDLPETVIAAMLCKPITALIEHPLLDDAMVVQEIRGPAKAPTLSLTWTRRPLEKVLESLNKLEMPA